ncbi:MAG: hypothetical protein V5B33_19225 [Candidatus Accumulibacter sp. UW20]|jgi:hypothetical protein
MLFSSAPGNFCRSILAEAIFNHLAWPGSAASYDEPCLNFEGLPVHLTTSDPAAHLTETLAGSLHHLAVSRIDPHTVTERYRQHVLETRGATRGPLAEEADAGGEALISKTQEASCLPKAFFPLRNPSTSGMAGRQSGRCPIFA